MNAMLANHGASAYQQVNRFSGIEGASAHQLIEMLLKGALDKIAAAKGFMARNEWSAKGEIIGKTIAILQELRASLNHEAGGTMARDLDNLYDYIIRALLTANAENDTRKLDEATTLLSDIYESWIKIPMDARG